MARRRDLVHSGYTLIELLAVVALLAIIANVAFSGINNTRRNLELAAREVSAALQFARSEALRTGINHGVRFDSGSNRIRVFMLTSPPTEQYTVYHPHSKQLYDIFLDDGTFGGAMSIDAADFRFGGIATPYSAVAFTKDGVPAAAADLSVMDAGSVTVGQSGTTATVTLSPLNGQVKLPW